MSSSFGKKSRMPRAVTCHICGRSYGTASICIHIPQCEALFVKRQELLPRSERRPLPPRPFALPDPHNDRPLGKPGKGKKNSALAFGNAGSMSSMDMDRYNDAAFKAYNEEALVRCEHCGRTFLPKALIVHQRSCTAEKPFSRPLSRERKSSSPTKRPPSVSTNSSYQWSRSSNASSSPQRPKTTPVSKKIASRYSDISAKVVTKGEGRIRRSSRDDDMFRRRATSESSQDTSQSSGPDPLMNDLVRSLVFYLRKGGTTEEELMKSIRSACVQFSSTMLPSTMRRRHGQR